MPDAVPALINERSAIEARLAAVTPQLARILPESLAFEFGALAFARDDASLELAFSMQPSQGSLNRIERATGLRPKVHVVSAHLLLPEIARCYGTFPNSAQVDEARELSAIHGVESLLHRAVLARASDIHLDPLAKSLRIRLRVDGRLITEDPIEGELAIRIFTRMKLLCGMDITERRLPQDGRFSFAFEGREIDIRAAVIPTDAGEKIALRLFDRDAKTLNLAELGFAPGIEIALRRVLQAASGFIVICGPTGSGKTTALYAMLELIDHQRLHLCSVEDPIERALPGVTQVPINVRAGMTFPHALRALLRQDPDVLLIGEVRDAETASTALGAALSGQLVLTTLHGADAARAIDRLVELGLTRSSIAGAMTALLSLRLVRRLCVTCRETQPISAAFREQFSWDDDDVCYTPVGCERCHYTGYRGRTALADMLEIDASLHEQIMTQHLDERFSLQALYLQGIAAMRAGITSMQELARIFPAKRWDIA